jgi:hypothetical protein
MTRGENCQLLLPHAPWLCEASGGLIVDGDPANLQTHDMLRFVQHYLLLATLCRQCDSFG